MRLINKSKYPDSELKEMFEFCAKPLGISAMTIRFHKTEMHDGYWGHSSSWKKEVDIATGFTPPYPYLLQRPRRIVNSKDRWEEFTKDDGSVWVRKKPGYVDKYRENPHLSVMFLSNEEWIVHLLGHELRHQWQRKRRPMSQYSYTARKYGSRSYFRRERDCDAYALNRLRAWRKLHAVDVYPEHPDK